VEDGDTVRRGKPTVWVKYGIAHAINVGDGMAYYAIKAILKCKERGVDDETIFQLLERFTDTAIRTAEGQAMDLNLRNNNNPTEEEYMKMVIGKTAYYLTIPMVGGAIIAGADDSLIEKLIEYGKYIGPAFQIKDDILDLTEGKGRDDIGNDIKEGKRSILVVYALERATEEERKKLLEILNKPREETTKEEVMWVIDLFKRTKAIERAEKKAEELASRAKDVIRDFPAELRNVLEVMADYMVKRKK
jgi:geranylgeranyl pyrophosphate synthase